jgi:hypothetical protein
MIAIDHQDMTVALGLLAPSIGASRGIGYGPGSLSSAYSNFTGTFGCVPGTTT